MVLFCSVATLESKQALVQCCHIPFAPNDLSFLLFLIKMSIELPMISEIPSTRATHLACQSLSCFSLPVFDPSIKVTRILMPFYGIYLSFQTLASIVFRKYNGYVGNMQFFLVLNNLYTTPLATNGLSFPLSQVCLQKNQLYCLLIQFHDQQ